MYFIALVVIWCIIFALWSWLKPRRLTPPLYPGALPLIGHGHLFIGDAPHMWELEKRISDYCINNQQAVELRFGPFSVFMITDPDDTLTVANTCFDKPYIYSFAKAMYGKGLVTASASTWKPHRKLLNPAFNQQVLHMFVEEYIIQAKSLVTQLSSVVGKKIDIMPYMINNLLGTVCRTTLGLKTDENSATVKSYAHATEDLFELYLERIQRFWLHLPYIFNKSSYKKKQDGLMKIIIDITNAVIRNRKTEMKTNRINGINKTEKVAEGKFRPLLDQLLDLADKQDAFTDEEIRQHLDTVVGAAYDTTATALTFSLLLIGSHQDVQERIFKELQEVLGNEDRDFNRHDLSKLVYMDAVIKESLRYFPPVPRIGRTSTSDVRLKNFVLPANGVYILSLYGVSRHPMWGPDVHQFNPERWLDPSRLPENPNLYASFSLGKRNCIGKLYGMMAIKTTLAFILKQYRIISDIENLQTRCDLILKPVSGHLISLERRV